MSILPSLPFLLRLPYPESFFSQKLSTVFSFLSQPSSYVVVAADYAGLGVGKDALGKPTVHEYLASSSHAHDVFYSVQAAQTSFPELSKHFVIIGHSQGGGVAWAAAQR